MVVARDCGLAGMGNCYLMSIEFPFCKKSSGDGWWRWLHNDMNVLSAEQCLCRGKTGNFLLCVFYNKNVNAFK